MIATVETTPLTGLIWKDETAVVPGTVTIVPTKISDTEYMFALEGQGEGWSVSEPVSNDWEVELASGGILYQLTFQFSEGADLTMVSAELQCDNTPGAFIVQEADQGSTSMLLCFLNNVSKAEKAQTYSVGFQFMDPNGQLVIWDPTIVFNPPD